MTICEIIINISISFGSAFFGFFLALKAEKRKEAKDKRETYNTIIDILKKELTVNKEEIEISEKEEFLTSTILTPAWDSLLHSGDSVGLIKYTFYDELTKCYCKIKWLNEKMLFNKTRDYDDERKRMNDIKNRIVHVLQLMDEKKLRKDD